MSQERDFTAEPFRFGADFDYFCTYQVRGQVEIHFFKFLVPGLTQEDDPKVGGIALTPEAAARWGGNLMEASFAAEAWESKNAED